jgi:hypothetical protein
MAALAAEERRRVWAHLMRSMGSLGSIPVDKIALRAAVDATDQWIEDNASSFNTALPQPFRGSANLAQKTLLFCYVAMRRGGVLRTDEDTP